MRLGVNFGYQDWGANLQGALAMALAPAGMSKRLQAAADGLDHTAIIVYNKNPGHAESTPKKHLGNNTAHLTACHLT